MTMEEIVEIRTRIIGSMVEQMYCCIKVQALLAKYSSTRIVFERQRLGIILSEFQRMFF
jgi:hypothetical protein